MSLLSSIKRLFSGQEQAKPAKPEDDPVITIFGVSAPLSVMEKAVAAMKEESAKLVDCLGPAAQTGHDAKAAVRAGDFDKAWGLYHEQKRLYLQHANQFKWGVRDTLSLDACVHENLADILRLEKRHHDALIHILYWVIAQAHRPIKRHEQKIRAYFNRCKLKNTTLEDVMAFVSSSTEPPDFRAIQGVVQEWVAKG